MHQYDIASELARLASILTTKAETADALAAEHVKLQRMEKWQAQVTQAKNARHFASVCMAANEKLKAKGHKANDFKPPAWEAVLDYAKSKHPAWPVLDVKSWFNHFETVGWVIGKDKPMRSWERAADNGFHRWSRENPGKARAAESAQKCPDGDPSGWREFLKSIHRPYKEYRYEMDFLKEQFRKQSGK